MLECVRAVRVFLSQIPDALMLCHGNDDLFAGAVAVGQHQEHVGGVAGGVGLGSDDADGFDAPAFGFLLGDVHLGVVDELLAVALWEAVGAVVGVDKGRVVAFEQVGVVAFGGVGGQLYGVGRGAGGGCGDGDVE